MTTFKKQMIAALSAGSMLFSMVTPAFAATIEISGNGASSDSEVEVRNNNSTNVVQTNTALVTNTISSSAKTGGNDANQNTGGDVLVSTGDAATGTKISNMLNSNKASVDCCDSQDVDVLISGNGANSDNDVELGDKGHRRQESSDSDIYVNQNNVANVYNNVDAGASTGKNDANQNTGGDVLVHTGDAATLVEVSTTANSNWAKVGGNGDQGTLSARILGNGAESDNEIELRTDKDITVAQTNAADVRNEVDAYASTGWNDANQNTGGDVFVSTGDADTSVEIDNMVNFNWADVDCGCVTDLLAKISGNGFDSENEIEFKNNNDLFVPQTNGAYIGNLLDELAKTGKNDVNQNTGTPEGGDPAVLTGDAYSFTEVDNTGNLNSFGGEMHPEWPEFDFDFNLSLNWGDLGHFLFWI